MPRPYSSLMVLRRRASRSGPSRLGGPGEKTQDNSDTALIRLLTSNKAYRTRRDAARAVGTRDFVRSACSRRDRVLSNLGNHSGRRVPTYPQAAQRSEKRRKKRVPTCCRALLGGQNRAYLPIA